MHNKILTTVLCAILTALCLPRLASAAPTAKDETAKETSAMAIELGAPFRDHAILQRDMELPVWGWSETGTQITVSFAGQKVQATAGEDGAWLATLQPLKTNAEPAEMRIKDNKGKEVVLKDILVGEVWLASGQSNMQWVTGRSYCKPLAEELIAATEGKVAPIREFQVTSVVSQLHPIRKVESAWNAGGYMDYSAIAFAFAHKLYQELGVPIGILNCSFSQTQLQAWVPREGFATAKDEYSRGIHLLCQQTDPTTPQHEEAWTAFYKSLEAQIAENEAAVKAGEEAKKISADLPGNLNSNRDATWLYNGRLSPVVPYAIRGAIWNQGYANQNEGLLYYPNLHSLVRGWRTVWNEPELPVYFHQFYSATMKDPGEEVNEPTIDPVSQMRHATWMARDIPNSGMASQIDITGAIHYRAKAVPGQRLALHALKNQYPSAKLKAGGQAADLVADGPMFKSYKVNGNKMIISFDHAKGGLVVAETFTNARSKGEGATGYADPKILENGDDQVKLFYLADEDRVWHPAEMKIEGDTVIVTSPDVSQPRGVSYATAGVGYQPNLYNTALLPTTPFILYDNEWVTSENWPDEKLKIAGEVIDPDTVGKLYEYRKMPLLSVQFRDNAVFQADQPVTIWGSTRLYGEWQDEPEKGDCKVHFEFGDIKKVIDVTPEMAEWKVTLPPMKAGPEPHTLKVHFTINGELVHERNIEGIVFGDVWCVVAPAGDFEIPEVKPSGQIVRMIQNQSNRDGRDQPSRFSICTSRTPRVMQEDGTWSNRVAAYWKDVEGMAAAIGNRIAAKTGRPVGILFLKAKKDIPIKNWIAPAYLNEAPSLMEDYKTVGSRYPGNPYYLENVRRYISEWKTYWGQYIPEMMETKAVPDGSAWGGYPSPKPEVGDSTATFEYNVYMHSLTPTSMSGILFLTGESMVAEEQGANFGPEMAALAKSFKSRFSIWHKGIDIPFFYTLPAPSLAPAIKQPEISGEHTAIKQDQWLQLDGVLDAITSKL